MTFFFASEMLSWSFIAVQLLYLSPTIMYLYYRSRSSQSGNGATCLHDQVIQIWRGAKANWLCFRIIHMTKTIINTICISYLIKCTLKVMKQSQSKHHIFHHLLWDGKSCFYRVTFNMNTAYMNMSHNLFVCACFNLKYKTLPFPSSCMK